MGAGTGVAEEAAENGLAELPFSDVFVAVTVAGAVGFGVVAMEHGYFGEADGGVEFVHCRGVAFC